jgi:DNA modification methylase
MEIKNISAEKARTSYQKMSDFDLSNLTPETKIGNDFVDFFTFPARLNTRAKRMGFTFWEFINNHEYLNRHGVLKLIEYYKGDTSLRTMYKIYKYQFGTIGLFRPIRAREVLSIYQDQITTVLDPTMGWGCRMTGAASLNIPHYIGIDLNPELREPLTRMSEELTSLGSQTDIRLFFQDAMNVDYSQLTYDCVFTSPPYFNTELYVGTQKRTKVEWIHWYKTLFSKIFENLKPNGLMILNVPQDIYDTIFLIVFGKPETQIPLLKHNRGKPEYIYVWVKK